MAKIEKHWHEIRHGRKLHDEYLKNGSSRDPSSYSQIMYFEILGWIKSILLPKSKTFFENY